MEDADILSAVNDPAFSTVRAEEMGPPLWKGLHIIARTFDPTPEKQQALREYVSAMATLLPCPKCSRHFADIVPSLRANSREEALKWSIDAHNNVNARLGKRVLTYKEALKTMTASPPECTQWSRAAIAFAVVAGILLLICVIGAGFVFRKHKTTATPT